jgi:hypothetical protein
VIGAGLFFWTIGIGSNFSFSDAHFRQSWHLAIEWQPPSRFLSKTPDFKCVSLLWIEGLRCHFAATAGWLWIEIRYARHFKAKLLHVGFHDLRHLFCSFSVMSGIDFMTIAAWLGHKDGGTLIGKVYGHLLDDEPATFPAQNDWVKKARKVSLDSSAISRSLWTKGPLQEVVVAFLTGEHLSNSLPFEYLRLLDWCK